MSKKSMKAAMESISLPLTDAQLRKLAKGQGVRVSPGASCTAYDIYCSAGKCKRMRRQMTKGKGFTVKLEPEELDENEVEIEGGRINWRKIGRTLRSTAKAVGKFYREKIRPVVGPKIREAVKTAIEEGIPLAGEYLGAITGQPEIVAAAKSPQVKRFAEKAAKTGTEKLSKLTGAFGVKGKKGKGKGKSAPKQRKAPGQTLSKGKSMSEQIYEVEHTAREPLPYRPQLQNNYSNFLNPHHPAMNPTLPMPDNSLPMVGRGLYAQGGGLYVMSERGRGMASPVGSAMNPLLPQVDNSTYYF